MSNIAARPTQGKQYKVVPGDRLDNIEKSAYGFVTGTLENANTFIKGRAISLENRPTIYPGDILFIPFSAVEQELKTDQAKVHLQGKSQDSMTLILEDREIQFDSMRIIRTMDTVADGWTARIQWQPGKDTELDSLLIPYGYPKAQAYIGNQLLVNGVMYSVNPEQTKQGLILNLEGFSYTADIIDSTCPAPYTQNNVTLEQRANQMLQNIGIRTVMEFEDESPFDKVTGDIDVTIFDHLASLAAQRGFLLSSSVEGNLIFTKTKTDAPVGTLESGAPQGISWGARFDGRLLFNSITAIGESPGKPTNNATVKDDNVPRSRFQTFKANETTEGNIEKAALWKRSKQFADALSIPFPVSGWYAPNDTLWRENTQVVVKSKEIFVPDGFTFLIRQCEYIFENSGATTTLNLVPPQVYTGERIVLPWEAV